MTSGSHRGSAEPPSQSVHEAATPSVTVVAAAADLIFSSRIRAAAPPTVRIELVRSPDALLAAAHQRHPMLLLVDLDAGWLDAPAVISELRRDPATAAVPIVAFSSHVQRDAMAAARAAGADEVLARSAFLHRLPGLLAGGQ